MATKNKLEREIENQAAQLSAAQREIVLSQFSDYKRNKARIAAIEDLLNAPRKTQVTTSAANAEAAAIRDLTRERAQLMAVNNEIAAKLFDQLSDRG